MLLYLAFILSTRSAWSMSLIFTFGVAPRSVTAAVGSPPTQKKASILRSLSALTDSATPSPSRFMSLSLSRPRAPRPTNRGEAVCRASGACVAGRGGGEPLALHVLVLVEAGRLDDAEPHHL